MSQPEAKLAKRVWQETPTANLVRYVARGTYYARARVGGKFHRQSLKTTVLTVARLRLGDVVKEWRATSSRRRAVTDGVGGLEEALNLVLERRKQNPALKPRSVTYAEQVAVALRKTWPELEALPLSALATPDAISWAAIFARHYAPSVFNFGLSLVRHATDVGDEQGATTGNVFRGVKRLRQPQKHLLLPTKEQFAKFVAAVRLDGSGRNGHCADLVLFLAYGGFRKMEAAKIRWQDCDFVRGKITVLGDPETGTKNSGIRRVPMIPQMRELLVRLHSGRKTEPPDALVARVRECQKAMSRAAASVGMARITHHDLRHLFATRCIESGVDIPTVSRWLGHKDGGALAMRVYGHLRHEHSLAMAGKVLSTWRRKKLKARLPDPIFSELIRVMQQPNLTGQRWVLANLQILLKYTKLPGWRHQNYALHAIRSLHYAGRCLDDGAAVDVTAGAFANAGYSLGVFHMLFSRATKAGEKTRAAGAKTRQRNPDLLRLQGRSPQTWWKFTPKIAAAKINLGPTQPHRLKAFKTALNDAKKRLLPGFLPTGRRKALKAGSNPP